MKIKPLEVIPDERGRLMEILRADDEIFERFGQVYYTTARFRVVKAWHYHKLQADHWVCLMGKARVGLYDPRPDSPSFDQVNEFLMMPEEPFLLKIPILVYHGFQGMDPERETMILNIPTVPYHRSHPDEYRVSPDDPSIPFRWAE